MRSDFLPPAQHTVAQMIRLCRYEFWENMLRSAVGLAAEEAPFLFAEFVVRQNSRIAKFAQFA